MTTTAPWSDCKNNKAFIYTNVFVNQVPDTGWKQLYNWHIVESGLKNNNTIHTLTIGSNVILSKYNNFIDIWQHWYSQLDEIEEQKIVWIGEDTTKRNSLCAYYEQIEDEVWFCLLFYHGHS
jgi:hypothetical protein